MLAALRKLLCFIAVWALMIGCFSSGSAQEYSIADLSESCPDDFSAYHLPEGGWDITGYEGHAQKVTVPQQIHGERVLGIYDRAMFFHQEAVVLILPKRLDYIGNSAFYGMSNLRQVHFPTSLRLISSYAFSKCGQLESILLPQDLTMICESAFSYCYSLTEVNIPDNVTVLGRYAFAHCDGLTTAVLPESLTMLEEGVFYACPALKQVTIPAGVKRIHPQSFSQCPQLVLTVTPGTEGERYALEMGIPCRYAEQPEVT